MVLLASCRFVSAVVMKACVAHESEGTTCGVYQPSVWRHISWLLTVHSLQAVTDGGRTQSACLCLDCGGASLCCCLISPFLLPMSTVWNCGWAFVHWSQVFGGRSTAQKVLSIILHSQPCTLHCIIWQSSDSPLYY
jgi:hypothetical protein